VPATSIQMIDTDERKSIQALFEEYHGLVLQSAFRITGSAEDAEDVLQTVFMRLLHREEFPDLGSGARAYLQRAAVNAALDVLRARKTAKAIPLEVVGAVLETRAVDRPDRIGSSTELGKWLRQAISQLRPKSAEVFVLRFLEGCSNQEIAELLGTSVGTVAVVLHRTRSRLQRDISAVFGGN
jgi:RNA polymerase sigma-70 factor, ECF subfamily